jgi:hypothetical protein
MRHEAPALAGATRAQKLILMKDLQCNLQVVAREVTGLVAGPRRILSGTAQPLIEAGPRRKEVLRSQLDRHVEPATTQKLQHHRFTGHLHYFTKDGAGDA